MRSVAGVVAATLVAGVACGGSNPSPPDGALVRCRVDYHAPPGYGRPVTSRLRGVDHVGIRVEYRKGEERLLALFSGVEGEFGERSGLIGQPAVSGDGRGRLHGQGDDWVLVWARGDRCDPRAVIGNGFTRREFMELLRTMGVVS